MKNIASDNDMLTILTVFLHEGNTNPDYPKYMLDIDTSIKIEVTKNDVCNMMNKYINNEISVSSLQDWAEVLLTYPCYISDQSKSDTIIWDVIKWLAIPYIYEDISPDVVSKYISQLSCNK